MDLYKIRKHLHQIPELGFEEFKTTELLKKILEKYSGIKIITFDFTGLLVEYSHGEGSYKLFRADIDALPIQEEESCPFHSQHPGVMHACGHDIHMTILLGLIDKVISADLKENLLFVFQPAEEGKGGAERILKTGALNKYNISDAYALHVSGEFAVGEVASKAGIFSPSFWFSDDVFEFSDPAKLELSSRLYFLVGGEEGVDVVASVDKMTTLLLDKGFDKNNLLSKVVDEGEHNELFWRTEFPEAILWSPSEHPHK